VKKTIFIFLIFLVSTNVCNTQEWFTSFEVAKKLALTQNKMLFVMWEDALSDYYQVIVNDDNGKEIIINLANNELVTNIIWNHFVPVIILETEYEAFSNQVKETRGVKYFNKLTDDSIKIMDVNGNILNINTTTEFQYENISEYISRYALNTSYIKQELENYFKNKNTTSTFLLASKYLDFTIFLNQDVRSEMMALANIYFDDAKSQLLESNYKNKMAFLQKWELLQIKALLILNKPKKARRILKKTDSKTIDKINQPLFSFLNYTMFKLLKDEENAALWKNRVSLVDLKKTELIINNNS